jgi:hypothetical protein
MESAYKRRKHRDDSDSKIELKVEDDIDPDAPDE